MLEYIAKNVNGLWINNAIDETNLRSALAYKPRDDDIFIVTYSKCGTTWMQMIVHGILNNGSAPDSYIDLLLKSPFLELMGEEAAHRMIRPGSIKTHFPFHAQPYSKKAKYIYVARNPFDCCLSLYNHIKSSPLFPIEEVPFNDFLDLFLAGKVPGGDYFDHLLSWYEHRRDTNVLFLTYEQLKQDTRFWLLRVANFIGESYGRTVRDDIDLQDKILKNSSFQRMKLMYNYERKIQMQLFSTLAPEKKLTSMRVYEAKFNGNTKLKTKGDFFNRGEVGTWRDHLTEKNIRDISNWIANKRDAQRVKALWKDIKLPW